MESTTKTSHSAWVLEVDLLKKSYMFCGRQECKKEEMNIQDSEAARIWETTIENGTTKAKCKICSDVTWRALYNCARHEKTQAHKDRLAHAENQQQTRTSFGRDSVQPIPSESAASTEENLLHLSDIGLKNLLHSLAGNASVPSPELSGPVDENSNNMFTYPDFFNLAAGDPIPNATLKQNPQQEGAALIAAALLARFEEVDAINSDDDLELQEPDEEDIDIDVEQGPYAQSDRGSSGTFSIAAVTFCKELVNICKELVNNADHGPKAGSPGSRLSWGYHQ
ncbi:hypothetical protein EV360DRAFT_66878 [Lentinula raphanica]|nr:hypothetical protein EV360DRAFT_66878 [Lentinula raphanica]